MTEHCDIVIAGGGLAGSAMALAAAQSGLSVIVVDPVPVATHRGDFDGRGYALALASQRMLSALGVWHRIADQAQPIAEVKASDGRAGEGGGPFVLHFDEAELQEGHLGQMVEDRHLRPALLQALAETANIRHLAGDAVVAQSPDPGAMTVTLQSGVVLTAGLLIGADGRQSTTARRAGIALRVTDYGQTALVAALGHSLPHRGIAHQFFMPSGPLAILPLRGNRSTIVWSESRAVAAEYVALDDAAFLDVLRPRFGSFLGEIALEGARWSYPLSLSVADRIVGARLALIGDAAQGMHPVAGQGLNQGLRDAATLAEILAEARRRGEDIGAVQVLERHRRWRSFDRAAMLMATDGFMRLFSNDNPMLRLGRGLGLGAVAAFPRLRQGLMREAAGLSGDLPRLLQGLSV